MKCPVCKEVNLIMSEKQGIEIDYCPECRGVWLDRGELDKIIEKSNNELNYQSLEQQSKNKTYYNEKDYGQQHNNHSDHYMEKDDRKNKSYNNQNGRKKESFMSNVFDMFGGD